MNANLERDGFTIKEGYVNKPEALNYSAEEFYEILLKEREEFGDKCAEVSMKPEYHDGKYGRTYNKDFMKEQC